jgi:tetratricopeptide (TPR) repeat protein
MNRAALSISAAGLAVIGLGLWYQTVQGRERDYRGLIRAGDAALQAGQASPAIEAFSNAIYLRSDSMLGHLRRGEAYELTGDLDAAARDFQTASTLDAAATRPLEALGDLRYRQERFRRAAEMYEQFLTLDDRSVIVLRKLALARYRDGDLDKTMDALEKIGRVGARRAEDEYLLGLCRRDRGQMIDAIKAFEQAIKLAPTMIPAREELSDLYGAAGRTSERLEQLRVLAGFEGDRASRHVALALTYARSGREEIAVEILRDALDRTSDRAQIYGAIGRIWLESNAGRPDPATLKKAIEALERVAPTTSATSENLTLYGHALLLNGQVENAERILQQATQRFPVDPSAFLEFASAAERLGHLHQARTALLQYGALTTNDHALAVRAGRIGAISLKLNEAQTAAAWLRRAQAALPDDLNVLTPLAEALARTGDRAGARSAALRGLRLDPTSVALRSVEIRTRDY